MTSPTRHIRLHATTTEDGKGLRQLQDDLDRAAGRADHLGHSLGGVEGDAKRLDVQIVETRKKIRDLGEEFEATGDTSLFGDLRKERARLRQLEQIAREAASDVHDAGVLAGREFAAGMEGSLRTPALGPALVGTIVAAAAALAPEIGAVIAGAVTGAAGVGGVIGGLAAASKDPRVRTAAREFGQDISSEFFGSGDAFVQPAIDSLGILARDFKALDIESTFAKAAPFVSDLAEGIGGFAKELNQGLNKALDRSGEVIPTVAAGLVRLGDGIGSMIEEMAASEGTIEGIRFLFEGLAETAHLVGVTTKFLGDSFDTTARFSARLSGALEDVVAVLPGVGGDNAFSRLNDHIEAITGTSGAAVNVMFKVNDGVRVAAGAAEYAIPTWAEYEEKMRAANEAMENSINLALGLDNANLGLQQSMLNLGEELKDNGRHWETNTEKGLANRRALLDAVAAAERKRQADIASGVSADTANAAFQRTINKLKAMALRAGITETALEDLVGDYNIDIHIRTHGALPRISYTNLPAGEVFPTHRAAGGPVLPDVPYKINERGSETVTFDRPGTVHPANLTPVAAGTMRLVLDVRGGDDDLKRLLKKWVRIDGAGSVQTAFGR